MISNSVRLLTLVSVLVALTSVPGGSRLRAQLANPQSTDKDPFIGVWAPNPEKTKLERGGRGGGANSSLAANLQTNYIVIRAEKGGLRQDHYRKGLDQPKSDSKLVIWDNKPIPNGNGALVPDEKANLTVAYYWRPDAKNFVRLMGTYPSAADMAAHRNFKRTEWVNWVISDDGKTLVLLAWSPDSPWNTNVQTFDYRADLKAPNP